MDQIENTIDICNKELLKWVNVILKKGFIINLTKLYREYFFENI